MFLEEGDCLDTEDAAVVEEAEFSALAAEDDSQKIHDTVVTNGVRGQAIKMMEEKGVIISQSESKEALQLFPRVTAFCFMIFIMLTLCRLQGLHVECMTALPSRKSSTDWYRQMIPMVVQLHWHVEFRPDGIVIWYACSLTYTSRMLYNNLREWLRTSSHLIASPKSSGI